MHHHVNGRFDWLISECQSVNSLREGTSVLSGKYKRFTVVEQINLQKQSSWIRPVIKVNGDSLVIYEYAYSLFISLCSVKSPITSSGKVAATPILKSVPAQFSPFIL